MKMQLPSNVIQAIVLIKPNFWSLNESDRDQFKVAVNHDSEYQESYDKAYNFLLSKIAPLASSEEEITSEHRDRMNLAMQYLTGIGPNYFSFNESFEQGKNELTFESLYDYDKDDYKYQNNVRKEANPEYQITPYNGLLYGTWARCIVDGRLLYPILTMAGSYMADVVQTHGFEFIAKHIPYRYIEGPGHGKEENRLVRWNMKKDANGEESVLKEMHTRLYKTFGNEYWNSLKDQFLQESESEVFLIKDEFSDESDWNLVFSSPVALKQVSLINFVPDVKLLLADSQSYLGRIEEEKSKIETWVIRELAIVREELKSC